MHINASSINEQDDEVVPMQEVKKRPNLMHVLGEDPMC